MSVSSASSSVSGLSLTSTTKEAKYLPDESFVMVTDDGSKGSFRDQRTSTSPIFGSRNFPPTVMDQRAFLVNRIACREVFFFIVGGPTFDPLRVPFFEAKKLLYATSRSLSDCWSTTADTSLSHDRSSDFFASVMTCCASSAAVGRGRPWA